METAGVYELLGQPSYTQDSNYVRKIEFFKSTHK